MDKTLKQIGNEIENSNLSEEVKKFIFDRINFDAVEIIVGEER